MRHIEDTKPEWEWRIEIWWKAIGENPNHSPGDDLTDLLTFIKIEKESSFLDGLKDGRREASEHFQSLMTKLI